MTLRAAGLAPPIVLLGDPVMNAPMLPLPKGAAQQ
jgi:hypothetical protein